MVDQKKLEDPIKAIDPKVEVSVVSYDDMTRLALLFSDEVPIPADDVERPPDINSTTD